MRYAATIWHYAPFATLLFVGSAACGAESGAPLTPPKDGSVNGGLDAFTPPPNSDSGSPPFPVLGCDAGAPNGPVASDTGALLVWANEGGDKVAREETRLAAGDNVKSRAWDGTTIHLFAARNETVSFNLVLEARGADVASVSVAFPSLDNGCGGSISATKAILDGVFDYTHRDIELFFIRYLPIKGLSLFGYGTYDELAVPRRLRRPYTVDSSGRGIATGTWQDRPDHDRSYPDIAVPMDLVPSFDVRAKQSQSVWADIYVPTDAAPGTYRGFVTVDEGGSITHAVPVELVVRKFALPDEPASKTALFIGAATSRYGTSGFDTVLDRHVQMAHRHRISVLGADNGAELTDSPAPIWSARFDGSLFSAARGYRGPGAGVANSIYAVGMYGTWGWQTGDATVMAQHSDAWATWFQTNAPKIPYFLYLQDEPPESSWPTDESWARWIKENEGPGHALQSMLTFDALLAQANVPDVDIVATNFDVADTAGYEATEAWIKSSGKQLWVYDIGRPASGTFMTDDDGVSPREAPWGAYKMGISRFFHWESTVYQDHEDGAPETDVFAVAANYGAHPFTVDPVLGETSTNHTNGNGLLFYPGTDLLFPAQSYGLHGPIASLRLKHWRRGITDIDYVALAAAKDAVATKAIVDRMVPKVLWEVGVFDKSDPTYQYGDVSWSQKPDDWEAARAALADIIEK